MIVKDFHKEALKPLSKRSTKDALDIAVDYEIGAMDHLASNMAWADRTHDADLYVFPIPDHRATLTVHAKANHWTAPVAGRHNKLITVNPMVVEPVADDERIDSTIFRESMTAAWNLRAGFNSGYPVFVNGVDIVTTHHASILAAPLPIACLAEATHGGYIALRPPVVRFLAAIALAAEARRVAGLAGGQLDVTARIGLDGSLVLRVSTDTITAVLEQAVLVRPFFDEVTLAKALATDSTTLATVASDYARRAYRNAVHEAYNSPEVDGFYCTKDESNLRTTAVFAGETGVSIARLPCRKDRDGTAYEKPLTPDTQEWKFCNVGQSALLTGDRAWQVIDGTIFEVLPFLAPEFTIGLTNQREPTVSTPVVLWTESGMRLALAAAGLES